MSATNFQIVFSDIGGVLGTNGWGSDLRAKVVSHFNLDGAIIDKRHHLMFDSYERGFLTFEQYLQYVFFEEPRPFALATLRDFIYTGSIPWPDSIELFHQVKRANQIKLALISNEGQGITEYRMEKFGLPALADFIIVSHYVHLRKPDAQIWELALNLAQVKVENAIYVDDREIFVRRAADLGFTAFQHVSVEQTRKQFEKLGLKVTSTDR
jgi:putative hydrolase of the HAD superfamily